MSSQASFFISGLINKYEMPRVGSTYILSSISALAEDTPIDIWNIETKKIDADSQKMYRLYSGLKRLKLVFLTHKFHGILKPFLLKNFNSSYASIILFDVYRIGYFCYLKTK